jgi:hypothetical protein
MKIFLPFPFRCRTNIEAMDIVVSRNGHEGDHSDFSTSHEKVGGENSPRTTFLAYIGAHEINSSEVPYKLDLSINICAPVYHTVLKSPFIIQKISIYTLIFYHFCNHTFKLSKVSI